jgi:hypothetical protein
LELLIAIANHLLDLHFLDLVLVSKPPCLISDSAILALCYTESFLSPQEDLVIPSNPSFEDLNNLFDPSHTKYLNRNALPTLTRLSSGLSTWAEVGRAPLPPKLQILRLSYPGYGIATSLGAMSWCVLTSKLLSCTDLLHFCLRPNVPSPSSSNTH